MRKTNPSFLLPTLCGLLTLCFPVSTQAIALLSDEFKLYLPWVEFQEQNYSVTLSSASDNPLIFRFDTIAARNDPAPSGALASVSDDLEMTLPLISFNGELYRASLGSDENSHFQIRDAAPIQISGERGAVLAVELVETKTTSQIAAAYPFAALADISLRYDVAVIRISYQTIDAFGNIISASGMIGVPLDIAGGVPLLSFQHGTITLRDNAPSANPEETSADLALYHHGFQWLFDTGAGLSGFW